MSDFYNKMIETLEATRTDVERAEEGNFSRVCTFFEREEMPAEFSVLAISLATRRNPKLAQTEALANWAVKNKDVLF